MILYLLTLLLLLPCLASAADQPSILVDGMGWKAFDGLAERGMRFTNAYAACPIYPIH